VRNITGNNPGPRERLEQQSNPVAILHGGMYVYANPAYLEFLGYRNFSDIEGIPVLDMVDIHDQDRFTRHFEAAIDTSLDAPALPTARFSLIKRDGSRLGVTATSHGYTIDDEPCVEIWLRTRQEYMPHKTPPAKTSRFYLSLVFLFILTVLPPTLMHKLDINNVPKVYFPDDEPAVIIDEALRENFPNDNVLILLFEDAALFSDGFLKAYHQLAQEIKKHPLVEKVFAVTSHDHISGSQEGFLVEPLINVRELEKTNPSQRQEHAIADRFARDLLVADDGSALSMIVVPVTLDNSLERLQLEQDVLAAIKETNLDSNLVALTGFIPLDVAQLRSMFRDNMIFIPSTIIIGLFFIWWLFRRWLAVILGGISISIVVHFTVALYVLADRPFTLTSSITPPLLSALTIAALVHLYNALHYAAQRGMTGQTRIEHALREVRRPAFFTALTTAAGLISLATSPIPATKSFGLIAAAGVVLIYLVVIIALPQLFLHWDHKPWPHRKAGLRWMDMFVRRLFHLGVRYPARVITLTLLCTIAGIPALWQVEVETSLQEFFLPEHSIRRDTDYFEQKMAGTGSLDVIFETQQTDGLKKPEYLAFMRSFQLWAEQLQEVDKTISPADFIEEMHWGFNAEEPGFRRIPENPQLVSQYLFIYDGKDIYDFVDRDFRTSHVNLSINVHTTNKLTAVMEQIRAYLHSRVPEGLEWEIAGYSRLFADMEDLIVTGQVYSLWSALGLIFLLMLILWRSFGAAVLCMIPNLAPILLIFIVMGLTGLWLDFATATIASVAVGIAIDDTIHVYHGYTQRLKDGARPVWALARTFSQAGRAVMTTTIILSSQFMLLTLSLFQPTAHFGLLTSIGLWAALAFDLLLLPSILMVLANYKVKAYKQQTS